MAHVVPTIIELDEDPMVLDVGTLGVLDALLGLDDRWSVYVKPVVGGLQPDFVVIHPEFGACVIEVEDWEVGAVRTGIDGMLEVRPHPSTGSWQRITDSPFTRVELVRREIIHHFFDGDVAVDESVRGVVVLPRHTTAQACALARSAPSPTTKVWGGRALGDDPNCVVAGHPRPTAQDRTRHTTHRLHQHLDGQLRGQNSQCL